MRCLGRFVALLVALVVGVAAPTALTAARASATTATHGSGFTYAYDAAAKSSAPTAEHASRPTGGNASNHDPAASSTGDPWRPEMLFVAAETAPEIAGGGGRIFVTSGRGTTYDIPEGWVGRNADNGKGLVYQRPGATGNADSIRIMEPTDKYPDGYVRVYNSVGNGQPVDVFGKPGPPADTHISQTYSGPWPGWPN